MSQKQPSLKTEIWWLYVLNASWIFAHNPNWIRMQKIFASLVKTTDNIVVKWATNRIDRIGIVIAVRITINSIKTNVFDLYNIFSVLF